MKADLKKIFEKNPVKFVDLRFTDLRGKEQHVTLPVSKVDQVLLQEGKAFDGSSIVGGQSINLSDLLLMPDISTAYYDPFTLHPTLILTCDIYDPRTQRPYVRDPRGVAKRAEAYLQASGIADVCNFGQEVEFFIFDDVRWTVNMQTTFATVNGMEAAWNTATEYPQGNMGHRQRYKGGYFPVPPVDSFQDIRSEMCEVLAAVGLTPEVHHHEVGNCGQNELTTRFNTLLKKCDEMLMLKYVLHNVAQRHGKTLTFMPKPLVGDNGSGLHCHQSLAKNGINLFAGNSYAGLSDLALYYIGGLIKHARALNAFTNPSTNSYKRLVPGYEAPITMVYSEGNRSAAIRIPFTNNSKEKRIEARFPDAMANSYLAFSAMLMAGLDGIKNRIHPGEAVEANLYELTAEQAAKLPSLCSSLDQALHALEDDYEFLLQGNVFNTEILQTYVEVKRQEAERLNMTTHPVEFDLYYSL